MVITPLFHSELLITTVGVNIDFDVRKGSF